MSGKAANWFIGFLAHWHMAGCMFGKVANWLTGLLAHG
jgi:hypothetical protein